MNIRQSRLRTRVKVARMDDSDPMFSRRFNAAAALLFGLALILLLTGKNGILV